MKKQLITLIVMLGLVFSSMNVMAKEITQFGDPDLIDLYASADAASPVAETVALPAPPVKIEKTKGDRYAFKVKDKLYWVSGLDVETSDRVQIESLCNSTQLATDYQSSHYGIRGAGVGCKK